MNIKRIFASVLFAITFAVGIVGSGLIAAQSATQPNFEITYMAPMIKAEAIGGITPGGTGFIEGHGGLLAFSSDAPMNWPTVLAKTRMPLSGSEITGDDFGLSATIFVEPD